MNPVLNLSSALLLAKQLLKRPNKPSVEIRMRMLQNRLLNDLTYRLPSSAKRDLFIGFKEWKRIISRNHSSKDCTTNAPFVLVSTSNQTDLAKEYISSNTSFTTLNVLVREELSLPSYALRFHFFALRISLKCLFDSRRINLALLIREVIEWTAIANSISAQKSTLLFDFTPFEKDSNALSYWLMENGIKVTKIPSPGPLAGHHTFMIADEVVLSSAYQLEEIPYFKQWFVSHLVYWPAEQYSRYSQCYSNAPIPPKNTIGFYSHGEWVRRKAGHANFGFGIQENELFLLDCLRIFLKKHPEFQLIVFPHPKERTDSGFQEFYASLFEGTKTIIAPLEMKSSENFFQVSTGVMAYSTIIFERLALGYKTLIGTQFHTSFPIEGSPLKNLCLSNYESFETAVLLANKETEKEFFERCGLEKYPLKEFLDQKVVEIQK